MKGKLLPAFGTVAFLGGRDGGGKREEVNQFAQLFWDHVLEDWEEGNQFAQLF